MTSSFGISILALAASGWIASAAAQTAAPGAVAPAVPPPAAAPAPPPDTSAAPPADTSATPPADTSATPAPAKPMHKMHHSMKGHGKLVGTRAGDAAVDDLNAKSLSAAKAGQTFTPPKEPIAEPAAHAKPMKHHHMARKTAKTTETPTPDAAAPAPDAAAPAPDATPK